jgi:hypothetical protein
MSRGPGLTGTAAEQRYRPAGHALEPEHAGRQGRLAGSSGAVIFGHWLAPQVSRRQPYPAHTAEGYYLGVKGSTRSLIVTHPGVGKVIFTGTVTLNAGVFRHLTTVKLEH